MRRFAFTTVLAAGLAVSPVLAAQEVTFTPPEGWLESATDEPLECPEGLQPQLTEREYYAFASRNQVWAQASINESDWRAGKVTKRPALQYPRGVAGLPGHLSLIIKVLVGEQGVPLDAVVTCSNAPELNESFLGLVGRFGFRASRYKDRELVTVFPIKIELSR